MTNQVELEQVQEFVDMLTDTSLPDGMEMPQQPRLSRREAFSVVWFLQERLRVLPDRYELCHICEELFDAHCEGSFVDGADVPGQWRQGIGITKEMLEQHDGTMFCSPECECEYWLKNEIPGRGQ